MSKLQQNIEKKTFLCRNHKSDAGCEVLNRLLYVRVRSAAHEVRQIDEEMPPEIGDVKQNMLISFRVNASMLVESLADDI